MLKNSIWGFNSRLEDRAMEFTPSEKQKGRVALGCPLAVFSHEAEELFADDRPAAWLISRSALVSS